MVFLRRFGGMATAANSGSATAGATTAAKPQAAGTVNDAKQGFAASAIDDKVDAKQIPNPAGYGTTESKGATADNKAAGTQPSPVADTRTVAPVSTPVVSAHLNPLLVAGVPLGAAVLLMGVYWLILRAGAV